MSRDPVGHGVHDTEGVVGWIVVVYEGRPYERVDQVHHMGMVDLRQRPGPLGETLEVVERERRVHFESDNPFLVAVRPSRLIDESLATTTHVHGCAVHQIDPVAPGILTGPRPERPWRRWIYLWFHSKPCTRVASTTATRLSDTSGIGTCWANIRAQIS